MLTTDQQARAAAALSVWFAGESPWGPAPWTDDDLARMHAALQAPTARDAYVAFAGEPDRGLVSARDEADNIALMAQIRSRLEAAPGEGR
jgi:hypothetical protein